MNSSQQICVLVIGMHRTGTSTIAGILSILGVDLGNRLLIPSRDNPKGYFEHSDIVNLNKAFLNTYNIDDDGLRGELPTDWIYSDRAKDFKERVKVVIKRDFSNSEIFGLKDPRISILLPIYVEIFKELGIELRLIISDRNIQDVVNSLHKRGVVSMLDSVIAYKYYYRIIKAYAESIYHIHIKYDDLINDSKNIISRVINFINHPKINSIEKVETEINRFIEPNLRHQNVSIYDFIYNLSHRISELEMENSNIKNVRSDDLMILNQRNKLLDEKSKVIDDLTESLQTLQADNSKSLKILIEEKHNVQEENSILKIRLHDNYEHIKYIDSVLRDRDEHISNLNTTLINIERSTVWKAVKFWDFCISLFFPKGSVIRNFYESVLRFVQNILNDFIPHHGIKILKKTQSNHIGKTEHFWKQFNERRPATDILFITHDESRTGAPRIVFDVADGVKNNYNVSFVSLCRGSMSSDFNESFGPVIYPDDLYSNLSPIEAAKKVIEHTKPKIVYANSIGSHNFAAAAKELGIPTIFHIHELDIAINMMFKGSARDNFKNLADIFIAVSEPVYGVLVDKLKCPVEKVVLINAFIDKEKVMSNSQSISEQNVLRELDKHDDEILVFCLGMFIYRKGADIFMKLAKNLKDKGLKCKFVWVGSKPFKEPFMSDFGLYSDYFSLIQEKRNPFPYLKAADIFVLPSREDPFPLVVLEAMSLGKPTIVFNDAGGIGEAVKDSGVLVKDFDIKKFEEELESLILNEEKRKVMGNLAIKYQERYDKTIIMPMIEEVIKNIYEK